MKRRTNASNQRPKLRETVTLLLLRGLRKNTELIRSVVMPSQTKNFQALIISTDAAGNLVHQQVVPFESVLADYVEAPSYIATLNEFWQQGHPVGMFIHLHEGTEPHLRVMGA